MAKLKLTEDRQKYYERRVKIYVGIILLIIFVIIVLSSYELPLPVDERGYHEISGNIEKCDIGVFGSSKGFGRGIYVDIYLEGKEIHFDLNASLRERLIYEELCLDRPNVKITYHALRLAIRPHLTYVIDRIELQKSTQKNGGREKWGNKGK